MYFFLILSNDDYLIDKTRIISLFIILGFNQFGRGGQTSPPIFRIALKNYFTSIASD